jgi:hypothetical protein
MRTVLEAAKELPVIHEADLCVIGGSCTGVFAAVRAARLGLRVTIVEAQNCFGGVAANAMVNLWHSLYDTEGSRQIIAGLTSEVIERLKLRAAVTVMDRQNPMHFVLNTEELKIELDEIVMAAGIKPFLHTLFAAPYVSDGKLRGVVIENKDGRGVILARTFVDASGDGDLAYRLGADTYCANRLQPGTTCAKIGRWSEFSARGHDIGKLYREYRDEYKLPETFIWGSRIPGGMDVSMLAATRVSADMSHADALTAAEIEGRRQVRAIMDLASRHCPDVSLVLQQLPSRIGVRETRHVRCRHQLTGDEVLNGKRFDDAIANGTYPSDLHHAGGNGITFRYLDGTQKLVRPGYPVEASRWREMIEENPRYYQIPYRAMVPGGDAYSNLIVAGRMIDADETAHAAIRVMVNMNQTGEAAGTAAYLALNESIGFADVNAEKLRKTLRAGGSALV